MVDEIVRWGDMDAFRHVNNVEFFRYFETGRLAYLDAIGLREGAAVGPILASTSCRFRRPLTYPDRLQVGVQVTSLDEDQFTHAYLLFSQRLRAVVATGEGVIVSYDYENACRAPVPAEVVDRMKKLGISRD